MKQCPECLTDHRHNTPHCNCGFAFVVGPPVKIQWLPSEEGMKIGVAEGTPLWEEIITPQMVAPPAEPSQDGRHGHATVGEGLTTTTRQNRIAALSAFYAEFGEHELPYEGGALDGPPEEVGPEWCPAPRLPDKVYRLGMLEGIG